MTEYIVIWKESPGQQISTVVDSNNEPILRDAEYLTTNQIHIAEDMDDVFETLDQANGDKIAVPPLIARAALGWEV